MNGAFTGEYRVKLDSKGRLRLPSQLLSDLGGTRTTSLIVSRGFEKCVMLYPEKVWETITAEIGKLNIYNKEQREFVRFFYSGAARVQIDTADRILVPKILINHADLQKEVTIAPLHDRFEIWPVKEHEEVISTEPERFADMAESVLGHLKGGFTPPEL